MNINRLIFTIEDCLNTLSRFSVASSFVEYCDLRTVIGLDRQDRERRPWLNSPYIAATKRGEYLSVFEVSGAFREMDEASDQTGPGSLESLITSMSDSLNTAYKNSGHKISFVFERDPDMGKEEIEDMVAPQKRKRAARTVLTGMCYSVGSATRQGSSSPTRFIGQSAMTSRT